MPDIWMDVDAAVTVPCNMLPLIDPTDFKSVEEAIAYNETGIEVIWHFVTTAGVQTADAITPTTGGDYDWSHVDGGIYKIEIPASGGASANNDTEGFGWITGKTDNCLPFRGPTIGFRAAGLNNLLVDNAYSATRGLAGTALPDAVAGVNNGLLILGTNTSSTGMIIASSSGNALSFLSNGGNGHGLSIAGNGIGNGIYVASGAGASGAAVRLLSLATDGFGVQITGSGQCPDLYTTRSLGYGSVSNAVAAPTTTNFRTTDITTAAADHWIGRVVVWLSGTLAKQVTPIVDYALVSGEGSFTVKEMTSAPSAGDDFLII